jgi:hypothetical protein
MIKEIPSQEGRSAEMMLYRCIAQTNLCAARFALVKLCPCVYYSGNSKRAEQILLQAGLVYRCVQMHLRLFNWKRSTSTSH